MTDKKFTVNVKELKNNMNFFLKYFIFIPIEISIKIVNYIYISLITSYFKYGIKPNISIEKVKFHTDIYIIFKNIEEVIHKTNRYSTLGVEKLEDKGSHSSYLKAFIHGFWSFFKHFLIKLIFWHGSCN